MLVIGGHGIIGLPGDGFLRSGEGYHFRTDIVNRNDNASVVACCRDAGETLRAWSSHGASKVYRSPITRRRAYPELNAIFRDFYPAMEPDAVNWHESRPRLLERDRPAIPEAAEPVDDA